MPYVRRQPYRRRRFIRRRPTSYRRTTYRKKSYIPRSIGTANQKVYFYKRHANAAALLMGTDGTDTFANYSFTLSSLPGSTDFTALYDFYKINKVVVRLMPFYTGTMATVPSASSLSTISAYSSWSNLRIFTAIDYNDSTVPTTIDSIREYQNAKVTKYSSGQTRSFTPRIDLEGTGSTTFQYTALKNPWIATVDPSVPHYSLKVGIDTSLLDASSTNPDDVLLRVEVMYYISFKSPN